MAMTTLQISDRVWPGDLRDERVKGIEPPRDYLPLSRKVVYRGKRQPGTTVGMSGGSDLMF